METKHKEKCLSTTNEKVHKYIVGCLKQDKKCQYALFKHFYAYAIGICRRYARNSDEASDILNESFFKIFDNLDKYDIEKPFKSWISKIITNTAIDYYRANFRFSSHEPLDWQGNIGNGADIYDKLAYDDLLSLIRRLTPAYRTVFNLYAIDGYNHNEIAEMLDVSIGTSKSNLHKARKKLQEMLYEYDETAKRQKNKTEADK